MHVSAHAAGLQTFVRVLPHVSTRAACARGIETLSVDVERGRPAPSPEVTDYLGNRRRGRSYAPCAAPTGRLVGYRPAAARTTTSFRETSS